MNALEGYRLTFADHPGHAVWLRLEVDLVRSLLEPLDARVGRPGETIELSLSPDLEALLKLASYFRSTP